MTKLKHSKSPDNRPGHKRYLVEKRWLENKKRKVAKYNREVERQRDKKIRRMEKEVGIERKEK